MERTLGQFRWAAGTDTLLTGEVHPFLEQVGSGQSLAGLNATTEVLLCPKIDDAETLGVYLEAYQEQLLYPFELPAIYRAFLLASHNQTRELIAFDQALAQKPWPEDLAQASRKVGQSQLQRLRPLRDQRVVQRYIQAVESGQANGWHTVIYGLTLAVYSMPVRQGLVIYARQTLHAFIKTAARGLGLSGDECCDLLEMQSSDMPARLEKIVARWNGKNPPVF